MKKIYFILTLLVIYFLPFSVTEASILGELRAAQSRRSVIAYQRIVHDLCNRKRALRDLKETKQYRFPVHLFYIHLSPA